MTDIARGACTPVHRRASRFRLVTGLLLLAACLLADGAKKKKSKASGDKESEIKCPGIEKPDLRDFQKLIHRAADHSEAQDSQAAQSCLSAALLVADNDKMRTHVIFNQAVLMRQSGNPSQALDHLLKAPPGMIQGWPQASHFLGMLHMENGNTKQALEVYMGIKAANPTNSRVYSEIAQAYYSLGSPLDAVATWKVGVVNIPNNAEGLFNVGILLRELGEHQDSKRSYQAAIRLEPKNSRYRYLSALRLNPTLEDALNNLGNVFRQNKRLLDSRKVFEAGIQQNPLNTNFLLNAGQVYQDLGLIDLTDAVAEKAFELNSGILEASILRGSVAYSKGDLEKAIARYREALQIDPTAHQPLLNLGNTLGDLYRAKEARMSNQNREAREEMHRIHAESISVYESMLKLNPRDPEAFLNMLWALKYACDWRDWDLNLQKLQTMVQMQLQEGKVPSIKPFLALAFPISPALYLSIAKAHAEEEAKKSFGWRHLLEKLKHSKRLLPNSRLRVAYMSTDLGDHPVGHQAWFWAHDKARIDCMLFALSRSDDSEWWHANKAMVPYGNFYEMGKLGKDVTAIELAQQINELGIHVLVTLNGWTSGHQIDLLAMRPSPIQVEYMGSHDSLGAEFVDIFVSDKIATPPEYGQPFYSEKIMVTPHSFFMNEYAVSRAHVPQLADDVSSGSVDLAKVKVPVKGQKDEILDVRRESHGLPSNVLLLCNFNQLFKVDPSIFATWMRILRGTPDTFLWLLRLPSTAEDALRKRALDYGEDVARRVLFSDRIDWKTHLVVKALANMSLDNPVFNSHTSGVDIIWAGVPLLTLPQETMSSRVAASLLHSVPFADLIVRDLNDYEETSKRLTSQVGRKILKNVRRKLQEARRTAELFETKLLVQSFEKGLLMAWESKVLRDSKAQLEFHTIISQKS